MVQALVMAFLLVMGAESAQGADRGEIARQAKAATALIVAVNQATHSISFGSGFFVDADGLVLTNAHVVEDHPSLFLYVGNRAVYQAPEVVAVDPDLDIAALRIPSNSVDWLPLSLDQPNEGDEIITVGYPRITDILQMGFALHTTVAPGMVSGVAEGRSRIEGRPAIFIQTTGFLQLGNSGGPLVRTDSGEVVGMMVTNVPYLERARDRSGSPIGSVMMRSGVSYSIPAQAIRQWLTAHHLGPQASAASSRSGGPRPLSAEGEAERFFVTGHLLHSMAMVLERDPDLFALAVRQYETAAVLRPDAPWVSRNLGRAYASLDRWDDALKAYRKALELTPEDPALLTEAGFAGQRTGHTDYAAEAYRTAIRVNPRFARAHLYLGSLLWEGGRLDEAIGEYGRALDSEPTSSLAAYDLGLAYEAKGLREEAVKVWQAFLEQAESARDPDGWGLKIRDAVARLTSPAANPPLAESVSTK
jgi:tetratricopeptide (TPR) repeat protein